jgi:hypothetical protein
MKHSRCFFHGAMDGLAIAKIAQDNLDARVIEDFGWREPPHEHANEFLFLDEALHKSAAE